MTFVPVDPGISEGNYTEWALKGLLAIPNGFYDSLFVNSYTMLHLDDLNDVITITWRAPSGKYRFAKYNISDLSEIFVSPADEDYCDVFYNTYVAAAINQAGYLIGNYGNVCSIQSYFLVTRPVSGVWGETIEVWRGNTKLWSRDITLDDASAGVAMVTVFSATGKYIGILSRNSDKLILYEGS